MPVARKDPAGQRAANDPGTASPISSGHATDVVERGFSVLSGVYADAEVDAIRGPLLARYQRLGSPRTWARPPRILEPDVEISRVGLVFHHLGDHFPGLAPYLVRPRVVEAIRATLGDDMHLEYTSAVLNHGERPFFKWHMHVGGVDNVLYRRRGDYPRFDAPERVATLLYLDDLDAETGTLRLLPRKVTDPTEPVHAPTIEAWPGQVELTCRRGDVVVMDQSTWHAAGPKRSAGARAFIACYWTSSRACPTSYVDRSLAPFASADPLLASVLP